MKTRPFLLLLLLAACAEGPEALVVHAPALVEISVGETARLEASGPSSQAPHSFRWTLTEKPLDSAPELVGVSASTLYVTPDRAGIHLVSVTVTDGSRTSLPGITRLVVHPAPQLAGTLTVRVLDASNRQPLPRATVVVEGLQTTTDNEGLAVLTSPGLQAPVTVHVTSSVTRRHDHDADPATAAVDWPWYRGATLVDVIAPELTVVLHPTIEEPEVPVRGRIDESLFALIPEVAPAFSLGTGDASGQARVVMVAPLPQQPLEQLHPHHLFTPRARSTLPANLTTDDESLDALAPFLGIDPLPDGATLTRFETRAAPGRQTFFVLGGVVTLHLDGVKVQPQADRDIHRLGRFETALSFAALVTLDVPPQGLDLSQPLRPEMFDELWRLDTRVEHVKVESTDLLTGEAVSLARVKLTGGREIDAPAPDRVPDPRLDAWQDRYLTVPGGSEPEHRLRVPQQTGPAATDLPFHLLIAAATTPAGVLPLGFALVRDMDRTVEQTTFRWPEATGTLEGARFEVMAVVRRGLWTSQSAGELVPGDSRQIREVIDHQVPGFQPSRLAHDPANRWNGLVGVQMGEREDPTRLPYDLVRAVPLFIHPGLPGVPGHGLRLDTADHTRVHSVLSRDYRRRDGDVLHADDFALWDTYQPAGLTTTVPWPVLDALQLGGEHTQLRLDVNTISADRRVTHDAFSFRMP